MAEKLELAEMIKGLRAQLTKAQSEGGGKGIRFNVEDVELDLEIAAEEQIGGEIAAKFYVLTSKLKAEKKGVVTQKIKLKLKPVEDETDPDTGDSYEKPVIVSGRVSSEE